MLEDKRKIKVPEWASTTFKNNGNGGIEGFIQANCAQKSRKDPYRSVNKTLYRKERPIIKSSKFVNPQKLNLENLTLPTITIKINN